MWGYGETSRPMSFQRRKIIILTRSTNPTCCASFAAADLQEVFVESPSIKKKQMAAVENWDGQQKIEDAQVDAQHRHEEDQTEVPCSAASPAVLAMVSGPPIFFREISPGDDS